MPRDADAHQNDMEGPICTYLIIGFTCVFSFFGFRSQAVEDKYIFDPERILAGNEFYRLITSSFLHSGWVHLMCNMISLNAYGSIIELSLGKAQFLLIYFGAVVGGGLLSLYLHRHHEYRAYGASGGVCGIIFAFILLWPGALMRIFPIPLLVPGWLFGIVFLVASFFMMKAHNKGNIGHDAHLGGAMLGFLMAAALHPETVRTHPGIFLTLLIVTVTMLIYVWYNPMFLPTISFFGIGSRNRSRRASLPKHRRENLEVDAILDKIARRGIESLSPQEKALLGEVSSKYKRRAESKKPESGLAI